MLDGRGSAPVGVPLGQALEGLVVGHAGGRALDDEVDAKLRYSDGAVRVLGQDWLLRVPGPLTT